MAESRYRLAKGSQVREEDFGLLFYRMEGPRLYFISSGKLISPEFFEGETGLEAWLNKKHLNISQNALAEIAKTLGLLCEKGVIIEC